MDACELVVVRVVDISALLPVAVTVGGWIATHVLSLRAQRRTLRMQVLDRARSEVTRELRAAQTWARRVASATTAVDMLDRAGERGEILPASHLDERIEQLKELRASQPLDWAMRLEEYEILFPETAAVRRDLMERQRQLHLLLWRCILLRTGVLARPEDGHVAAREAASSARDQEALIQDLMIHLQNQALSEVMDREVPPRSPPAPNDRPLPRITAGANGVLRIEPVETETRAILSVGESGEGGARR